MNSKERTFRALTGERVTPPPVVLHSWGDYKVQHAGIHPKYQYYLGGPELAEVERGFYERFKPDWIHLGSGADRIWWNRPRRADEDRAFIRSADDTRWLEIRDNYILAEDDSPRTGETLPGLRLESLAEIDDYFAARSYTEDDILSSGRFEHLAILSRKYGDRVLIAVNDGAPGCGIPDHSFEDAMIACARKPDLVAHCIRRSCERFLADVRAAKACGAHAYIFSEGFGGSLDLLSPEMHERRELDTKRWFYSEVRRIGMLGIGYWLGDVRPNMRLINEMDMAALMIEEDKKGFTLDPVEIRRALRSDICLIGNVDSALLLRGEPDEIRAEVWRQLPTNEHGPFVLANGSPLILGTPAESIDTFIGEARPGS